MKEEPLDKLVTETRRIAAMPPGKEKDAAIWLGTVILKTMAKGGRITQEARWMMVDLMLEGSENE